MTLRRPMPSGVLDGGRYFEGPRWHLGRLWFVDCMDRTLLSLDASGAREQHAKFEDDTPCGLGVLPDGKLVVLTMFRKRLMSYADGQLSLYADLSGIATGTIDDMIVDGLGRAYVGDLGFDLPPPPDRGPVGRIILVMPDGERLVVAEMDGECLAEYDIEADGSLKFRGRFGNMKSPDGICLDREEAAWVASFDAPIADPRDRVQSRSDGHPLWALERQGRVQLGHVSNGRPRAPLSREIGTIRNNRCCNRVATDALDRRFDVA